MIQLPLIHKGDSRYVLIDQAAFASKNLYNLANYPMRQSFIHTGKYMNYAEVYHLVKQSDAYKALPRKVSNDVLRLLDKDWKAYRKALAAWREDPSAFLGRPCLPKYKDKKHGRNILIYDMQALSKPSLSKGVIAPSQLGITVPTRQHNVKQVRIIPRHGHYVVEVVYERQEQAAQVNPDLVAGIDIGLNNLATLTSNKPGFRPLLVNGRPLKSINQYYNKRKADLESKLMKMDARRRTSHQLEQLTTKRTRKINHYLHTQSHRIVEHLVKEGLGTSTY